MSVQFLNIYENEAVIIRNMHGIVLFAFTSEDDMQFSNEEIIVIDDKPMHIIEFTDSGGNLKEIRIDSLRTVLEINTKTKEVYMVDY